MKTDCCRVVGLLLAPTKASVKCLQLIVLKLSGFIGWTPLMSPLLAWMWLQTIQWAIYVSFFIWHAALRFSDSGRDGQKRSLLLTINCVELRALATSLHNRLVMEPTTPTLALPSLSPPVFAYFQLTLGALSPARRPPESPSRNLSHIAAWKCDGNGRFLRNGS